MDADLTPQQRAGLITWHLCHGEGMQTRDVANLTGLSMSGALYLMWNLSTVLPIYQDDQGMWVVCAMLELEYAGLKNSSI